MQTKTIYIHTPVLNERKTAGKLHTDNGKAVFFKRIKHSKHYMRILSGYGIDQSVYEEYIHNKSGHVVLYDMENRDYIMSDFEMWKLYGRTAQYTKNAGKQRFLSEKYMTVKNRSKRYNNFNDVVTKLLQ